MGRFVVDAAADAQLRVELNHLLHIVGIEPLGQAAEEDDREFQPL